MGASGWSYWTDYQDDIEGAFFALREQIYAAGDYLGPGGRAPFGKGKHPRPRPASIEDLVESQEEEGTHSVLDVATFGAPRGATMRLATDAELERTLGTSKPSREQVKRQEAALFSLVQRWNGICVVTWKDDAPDGLFFCGFSGD